MSINILIWIPILFGFILLAIPRFRIVSKIVALLTTAFVFYQSIQNYFRESITGPGAFFNEYLETDFLAFRIDALSNMISVFITLFAFLIVLYVMFSKNSHRGNYYGFILMTLGASNGAVFSDNLILFLIFWGFLAITLYKMIPIADEASGAAAVKSLIMIGGSDVIMLVGIGIIWQLEETMLMSELSIATNSGLEILAFILLLIGSFAKAGAFPLHTWVPDFTVNAPAPSSAYLPASLDKLLGIYLLTRLCNEIFILNQWLVLILLIIGVSTIIIGVMMALVQHDYRKLLGYHAVSQVGYMITGLGLGTVLGIIGGLFHMINNALYKSGLFLVAGSIQNQTGESNINKLGGLSRTMPVTFISALVFALAISGVPPFNGFASKWIIYQAIVDFGTGVGIANNLWMLWLALAVIGSALTLASFIKFISGIFLGRATTQPNGQRKAHGLVLLPLIFLGLLCIGFGVFATDYVVPFLFSPIVGEFELIGLWNSTFISLIILVSILLGIGIYALGTVFKFRKDDSFIGGESMQDSTGFAVTGFYQTIKRTPVLSTLYDQADKKWFDLYHLSKGGVLRLTGLFRAAHNGMLQSYILWMILGLIVMLAFLLLL